ncbi:MAG: hypothetical protein DRI69_07570 [Bacteroidetes bacterium]|nr:MAG: hypothetical protein DRI69_07570 [Bacteroidota bacterium]
MDRKTYTLAILFTLVTHMLIGQTVGLFLNDSASYNGYTLFSPTGYETTYLIDNCGELVNSWESNFNAGQIGYLLEDGSLLRTGRINSSFNGGGSGGLLEIYNWEGDLTWSYIYSTDEHHQHHDVEALPNGNILILAWEFHERDEAIASGRNPAQASQSGIWSEQVVEIKPIGANDAEIVWEWHAWDHLVQDFDNTVINFGQVVDHPELINFNFTPQGSSIDWIHANSVDYNPELDQVMINCRNFEELWIIDHSTTTSESSGHTGGNQGKGGDLLYRWGNPIAYNRGTNDDAVFYVQHDSHWITEGLPDAGKIIVFNNGAGRPGGSRSSIDIVAPAVDSNGGYLLEDDVAYGPDTLYWSYDGGDDNSFYAQRVSGAERMPNGNTLICVGVIGEFFEINAQEEIVWTYRSPISRNGPVPQGQVPSGRDVFRVYRYDSDFPGLAGRDLSPMGPLELNPLPNDCVIYGDSVPTATDQVAGFTDLKIYPNPVFDQFSIETEEYIELFFDVVSSSGVQMFRNQELKSGIPVPVSTWPSGIYFIQIHTKDYLRNSTYKVIKI